MESQLHSLTSQTHSMKPCIKLNGCDSKPSVHEHSKFAKILYGTLLFIDWNKRTFIYIPCPLWFTWKLAMEGIDFLATDCPCIRGNCSTVLGHNTPAGGPCPRACNRHDRRRIDASHRARHWWERSQTKVESKNAFWSSGICNFTDDRLAALECECNHWQSTLYIVSHFKLLRDWGSKQVRLINCSNSHWSIKDNLLISAII